VDCDGVWAGMVSRLGLALYIQSFRQILHLFFFFSFFIQHCTILHGLKSKELLVCSWALSRAPASPRYEYQLGGVKLELPNLKGEYSLYEPQLPPPCARSGTHAISLSCTVRRQRSKVSIAPAPQKRPQKRHVTIPWRPNWKGS
jgi:hypothetical protein